MDRDYFEEAFRIVKGQTMLLPERAHLEALVRYAEELEQELDNYQEECLEHGKRKEHGLCELCQTAPQGDRDDD